MKLSSDIASSTNRKCSLNWKLRHPERKSFLKENSTRHVFLKFSPCYIVKFAHFGEHFSLKTPMECVYVCLLLDLLVISLHFNQKFTRKLHYGVFLLISKKYDSSEPEELKVSPQDDIELV